MRPRKTLLEVLGDKVLVGDDCWEWIGGRGQDGYGHVAIERRPRAAHRVMYELLVGPIPEGLQLDHLCRNRSCVRPDHLALTKRARRNRRSASNNTAGIG